MNDKLRRAREVDRRPVVGGVRYSDTFKLKTPISRDGESRGGRKARRTFRRGG